MSSTSSIKINNFARTSMAAVAIAALVVLTACGSSANSSPPAQGIPPQSASGTKDNGFTGHVGNGKVAFPTEWKDSSGWFMEAGPNIVTAGNYVGYLENTSWANGAQGSTPGVLKPGTFVVVDGAGNRVYTGKAHDDFTVAGTKLFRVSKDGKGFIVVLEGGPAKGDPTSAKVSNNASLTAVTIIDESGKEVVSTTLAAGTGASVGGDNDQYTHDDSIRISVGTEGVSEVMDVATGKISPLPSMPDATWEGRFDGVDIFSKKNVGLTDGDGTWTAPVENPNGRGMAVRKFGKVVQSVLSTDPSGPAYGQREICHVLDPRTGRLSTIPELSTGDCVKSTNAKSPNGNIIAITTVGSTNVPTVINIDTSKVVRIGKDFDITVRSVTDSGDVYAEAYTGGSNHIASFNVNNGSEPKVDPGALLYPYVVSSGGLAVFPAAMTDSNVGMWFVVKK